MKYFVLFLTFAALSCSQQKWYVNRVEGKQIAITSDHGENDSIERFIKPYRDHIDNDLNLVLAYSPETLDKSKGQWQTAIGNLLADVTLQKSNPVFMARTNKPIDMCLLNQGGIRSIIAKGNVTARTAFEIMPFENTAFVVELKGEQIREMIDYIISEKKPHPLSGMTFTIDRNNTPQKIMIQKKPLENDRIYNVVTSDYLLNGGDNMAFFKKGLKRYDLDYKLRNMLIDYFKETDTIPVINDIRINVEK